MGVVCPRCKSTDTDVQLRSSGTVSKSKYYRTGVKNSWILPAGQKTYRSSRKQKSVGLCKNCGYCWDIDKEHGCLFYLLCLMFFPITLSVMFYRFSNLDKKYKLLILLSFWVLFIAISAIAGNTK